MPAWTCHENSHSLTAHPGTYATWHETWKITIAIVTNCAGMDARAIVAAYERRWNIEVMFKDLEQSLGLGESGELGNSPTIEVCLISRAVLALPGIFFDCAEYRGAQDLDAGRAGASPPRTAHTGPGTARLSQELHPKSRF